MADPVINGLGTPLGIENNPKHYNIQAGTIDNSFADLLANAIHDVDSTMKSSEASVQDFITGKTDNIHDVMISMQKAQLSFQMMVEIRNRMIDTYQEISRMQV